MFIATLFSIAKIQQPPKCTTIDESKKRQWYIHTVEYYWTTEILPFATAWMRLQSMPSEVDQTEKT